MWLIPLGDAIEGETFDPVNTSSFNSNNFKNRF